MKRVAPSTDDARRRKSARIATQTLKCPLPKEEKYTHAASKDSTDGLLKLENVTRNSELYNALLPYAQNHPEAVGGSSAVNSGEAFLRSVREVDEILAGTKQRLHAKYEEMRFHVIDFASSVRFKLDRWYEGGDIFDLPAETFASMMNDAKAPFKEVKPFVAYLERILPLAVAKQRRADEYDTYRGPRLQFADKVLLVVQALVNAKCHPEAFQLVVLLKTLHGTTAPRLCQTSNSISFHGKLEDVIRGYLEDNVYLRNALSATKKSNLRKNGKSLFGGLVFSQDSILSRDTIFDFAAAARRLRDQYIAVQSLGCSIRPLGTNSCFLKGSIDVLERLQKKAWSDTKFRVFSTIGTLLPAELAEHIFEYTVYSEGIPIDPSVEEHCPERIAKREAEPSTPCRRRDRIPEARRRVVKDGYLCRHFRMNEMGVDYGAVNYDSDLDLYDLLQYNSDPDLLDYLDHDSVLDLSDG